MWEDGPGVVRGLEERIAEIDCLEGALPHGHEDGAEPTLYDRFPAGVDDGSAVTATGRIDEGRRPEVPPLREERQWRKERF